MNIADHAIKIIKSESPSVDIEWLEFVSDDIEHRETTEADAYQTVKGFIRGLMATGTVGVEVISDIDEIWLNKETY